MPALRRCGVGADATIRVAALIDPTQSCLNSLSSPVRLSVRRCIRTMGQAHQFRPCIEHPPVLTIGAKLTVVRDTTDQPIGDDRTGRKRTECALLGTHIPEPRHVALASDHIVMRPGARAPRSPKRRDA